MLQPALVFETISIFILLHALLNVGAIVAAQPYECSRESGVEVQTVSKQLADGMIACHLTTVGERAHNKLTCCVLDNEADCPKAIAVEPIPISNNLRRSVPKALNGSRVFCNETSNNGLCCGQFDHRLSYKYNISLTCADSGKTLKSVERKFSSEDEKDEMEPQIRVESVRNSSAVIELEMKTCDRVAYVQLFSALNKTASLQSYLFSCEQVASIENCTESAFLKQEFANLQPFSSYLIQVIWRYSFSKVWSHAVEKSFQTSESAPLSGPVVQQSAFSLTTCLLEDIKDDFRSFDFSLHWLPQDESTLQGKLAGYDVTIYQRIHLSKGEVFSAFVQPNSTKIGVSIPGDRITRTSANVCDALVLDVEICSATKAGKSTLCSSFEIDVQSAVKRNKQLKVSSVDNCETFEIENAPSDSERFVVFIEDLNMPGVVADWLVLGRASRLDVKMTSSTRRPMAMAEESSPTADNGLTRKTSGMKPVTCRSIQAADNSSLVIVALVVIAVGILVAVAVAVALWRYQKHQERDEIPTLDPYEGSNQETDRGGAIYTDYYGSDRRPVPVPPEEEPMPMDTIGADAGEKSKRIGPYTRGNNLKEF